MIRKLLLIICLAVPALVVAETSVLKTVDVVDDYFGTKVADPYRWLEDESLPETQTFIAAENARTRAFIDSPVREQFERRITELYDFPRQSTPSRKGQFLFYSTNTGLQNQSVLRVAEKPGDAGTVLLDPNQLSEDGTVSLRFSEYSKDGTLMAYGLAQSGSDHSDVRVKDVVSGKDLPDLILPARVGAVQWLHDKSGFYYGKYPKTTEHGRDEQAYGYQLFFHKLGTATEQDKLIYERPDDRELSFAIAVTDDGKYELMHLSRGTRRENRLYWRPAGVGEWNKLIDHEEFQYDPIDSDGSMLYVRTTDNAPRGRVIAIDLNDPGKEKWKQIIPQTDEVLGETQLINDKLIASLMRDAHEVLKIFNKDGTFEREVKLPTIGSLSPVTGQRHDTDFFYSFTSYSYPTTAFRYDLKTNTSEVVFAPQVKFTPGEYETKQLFATSKDGTKVPVFIAYKKGLKLDGGNPTILDGYGGFTVKNTPHFSPARIAWLERGGVYAEACLRGGSEYGEAWHRGGMLDKKQNVFDDFHACAELLIKEGFTSTKRLAIEGGSNGGLLVAACMLQRPDLYGAVICHVPLTDMLRYHKLGIGRFWTVEYGNAESTAEEFKYLYAYSPLHNIKPGQTYPPILIATAEGDNRVVPGHSYKFTAALRCNASSVNPILLRVETKAGHGGGKPTSKIIDEVADVYAFLARVFAMK